MMAVVVVLDFVKDEVVEIEDEDDEQEEEALAQVLINLNIQSITHSLGRSPWLRTWGNLGL